MWLLCTVFSRGEYLISTVLHRLLYRSVPYAVVRICLSDLLIPGSCLPHFTLILGFPLRSTVQYSTVQYSTIQSTVQYNAEYSTVQYSTMQYSTMQVAVQYSTMQGAGHPHPPHPRELQPGRLMAH